MNRTRKKFRVNKRCLFDTVMLCLASIAFSTCAKVYMPGMLDWIIFLAIISGFVLMIYELPFAFVAWCTAASTYVYIEYSSGGVDKAVIFGAIIFVASAITLYKWKE